MIDFIAKYWLEVVFGVVSAGFGWVIKKMSKKINEQEAIKMGVQALLRDRIIQAYNEHQDKGYCPIYARENVHALAKEYTNLGGNGVVTELLEKMSYLPTSPPPNTQPVDDTAGC